MKTKRTYIMSISRGGQCERRYYTSRSGLWVDLAIFLTEADPLTTFEIRVEERDNV